MKIELNKIKASPKPIRTSWDEERMCDLANSLKEEGQVEPIGVHADGEKFTIVWGHRRVEAARRAGWYDIEAVIVPQDEVNNLIQAGIENLAKEEMSVDDKSKWAQRLVDMGLKQVEISKRSGISIANIADWLFYKREGDVLFAGEQTFSQEGDFKKVINVARVLGNDLPAKQAVLEKTSEEKLSRDQAKFVAEAYRDAPTPEVKKKILDLPVMSRDTAADILRKASHSVEMESGAEEIREMDGRKKEREDKEKYEDYDVAVKKFLDGLKAFQELAREGSYLVKFNKYSPEGARFAIRKIDSLMDDLKNYRDALEGVK